MNALNDQLSWEQFQIQSSKAKKPIKKISEFNRLIAHSENFFSFWIWSIYRWIYFNNNERIHSILWPCAKQ